ncbi:hypothetical protein BV25DRAFT_1424095 [Artomyces pyxidatus]|uniref:Uncharacterized protein n=1 Tax=Artomyces pyxidatus TaxID=48021 RepID=A0ACB8TE86_9AGAM|nr:hypothetical protein BV25DRAFT_1424095 [Artomyces pyxidatus]
MSTTSFTPTVHRLPPEVLIPIFALLVGSDVPDSYNLIPYTHVCRRWRDIVTACPSLWRHVGFDVSTRWVEEILLRAQDIPVSIHSVNMLTTHHTGLILQHLPHTRHLLLVDRAEDGAGPTCRLHKQLTTPAPILESFTL